MRTRHEINGVVVYDSADTPEGANEQILHQRAEAALPANTEFSSRPSQSAAQAAAQIKALTQQVQTLTRLLLGKTEETE